MSKHTHHPICPKCGYDQSGEIATWESSCPIEGICPECGLGFDWADVFDPGRVHLPWYTEHAEHTRGMIRRSPMTLWFLLLPHRFWKRVTVASPVYAARLWSYVAAVVVSMYLATTLLSIATKASSNYRWNQLYASFQAANPGNPMQGKRFTVDMGTMRYWWGVTGDSLLQPIRSQDSATQIALLIGGMALLWAVVIAAVPTTRRIAQVRLAHVHRAAAWSCFVIACLFCIVSVTESIATGFSIAGRGLDPSWPGFFNVTQMRFTQAEAYSRYVITGVFLASLIWIQWFWLAATVRGWRIRSIVLPILGFMASLLAGYTAFMYISAY